MRRRDDCSGRTGPPLNPGLRDLVVAKRRWSGPRDADAAKRGFRGWHERGYLPHRDEPGLIQFVTFRLAGSFPASLRSEWAALLEIGDDRRRHRQLEAYLDKGRGPCFLRTEPIGSLVDEALRFQHSKRYELEAWVVMPNHVHVLLTLKETSLSRFVADRKQYIARRANRVLARRGQFWAEDYWDTFIRDASHESQTRRYIESNPVKAGLVREAAHWPWCSARFRDEMGILRLP